MDRDTNTKIAAFVILSVMIHALIIYVVAKTKFTEPDMVEDPENIEFITDQNETVNENIQPIKPQKVVQARPQRAIPHRPKPRKKSPPPLVKKQPKAEPAVAVQPNQPDSSVPLAMEEKLPEKILPQNATNQLPIADVALPLKEAVVNETDVEQPTNISESVQNEPSSESIAEVTSQEDTAVQAENAETETVEVDSDAQALKTETSSSGESSVATAEIPATEGQDVQQTAEGVAQADSKTNAKQGKSEGMQASEALGEALNNVPVYQREQLKILRPTSIVYPEVSRRLKEVGTAKLRVLFNEKGVPQKTMLVKSTGSKNLDQAALQGMRTLRFKPLGHPFIYETPVQFQLEFNDQQLNQLINSGNESQMKAQVKDNEILE